MNSYLFKAKDKPDLTSHPPINGESINEDENQQKKIFSPHTQTPLSTLPHIENDNRFSFATEEYAHLLPTWPKVNFFSFYIFNIKAAIFIDLKNFAN